MDLHVGQPVICIDDAFRRNDYSLCERLPTKGQVYHVRDTDELFDLVALDEVVNPTLALFGTAWEPMFPASRFRPVKATDISVFTEMCKPTIGFGFMPIRLTPKDTNTPYI